MERIFEIAGRLCILGFATGIITWFIPEGKTEKILRLVVTLYIIMALFTVERSNGIFSIGNDIGKYEIPVGNTEKYIADALAEQTKQIISEKLSEKNICYTDIDVHINKQTDKFAIDHIVVYGADNIEKLKEELADVLSGEKIISGD